MRGAAGAGDTLTGGRAVFMPTMISSLDPGGLATGGEMSGDQRRVEELADVLERAVGELHRLTTCSAGLRPAHPPSQLALVRRLWLVHERLGDALAEMS